MLQQARSGLKRAQQGLLIEAGPGRHHWRLGQPVGDDPDVQPAGAQTNVRRGGRRWVLVGGPPSGMTRGEVWVYEPPHDKRRPALILTRDEHIGRQYDVIAIPDRHSPRLGHRDRAPKLIFTPLPLKLSLLSVEHPREIVPVAQLPLGMATPRG